MKRLSILFSICALCAWASTVYEVRVQALIDGDSQLILQGNTVQWHNLSWCAPGRHSSSCGDTNQATVISTWVNSVPDMVNYQWTPTWSNGISGDVWSEPASILSPSIPGGSLSIGLTATSARGNVTVVEDPQTPGRYILSFYDDPDGGSANYDVTFAPVLANGDGEIPEPGTAWLLVAGTLCLSLLRRR